MDSLKIQKKVRGSDVKTTMKKVRLIWLNHIEKEMMELSSLEHKNGKNFQTNHKQKIIITIRKKGNKEKTKLEGDVGKVSHWTLET